MVLDSVDFKGIRAVFSDAGYTEAGILEALKIPDVRAIRGDDVEILLQRTAEPNRLNTLIRLFCMEVACERETVAGAIAPMSVTEWADAGILTPDGAMLKPCMKILPYHNLLLAFDPTRTLLTPGARNYVMGIGSSTLTLANLTIRKQTRGTLDLGTGCGSHAFLASPHSSHVYGVDINSRAVNISAFNGLLNGLENVSFFEGNLFEPVKDKTFDLIISNPPSVISPENAYIYRDGGYEADGFTQKIVELAPMHLNEGGFCQVLCFWVQKKGEPWKKRLESWFEKSGCDVWVMCSETMAPETYAATWIRHTERGDANGFGRSFAEWTAYYDEQGIEAVCAGLINMRRSDKVGNWFRADDTPDKMFGPCGDSIVLGFELKDFIEDHKDDEELLKAHVRVCPDVCIERRSVPTGDGWEDASLSIHLTKGFGYSGNIDYFVADLIMACDGNYRLCELLARMSRSLKKEPGQISKAFCSVVRGLIERGFLLP